MPLTRQHRSKLLTMLAIMAGLALLALYPVLYVLLTADYPGASQFYGVQEDHAVVDALISLSQRMR